MGSFRSRVAVGVLAVVVGGATAGRAQEAPAAAPVRGETARAVETRALSVVAQFLQLRLDQAQALAQMLQARQAAIAPLLQQIAVREEAIRQLLAGGGDPAQIGTLMVQVHQLRQQVAAAQATFLSAFHALLDEAQRGRLAQAHLALQLQPVLPAFQALQLF
jgi:hypothetical protein